MKFKIRRLGFTQKFIVSYAIIAIITLVSSAVFSYVSTSQTVEVMLNYNMSKILSVVRAQTENYVDNLEKITLAPTFSKETQNILISLKYQNNVGRPEAENNLFNTFDLLIGLREDLLGIYIFDDLDNRYYKTSYGDITPLYSFYQQDWFKKTKELNGEPLLISTHKTDYFVSQYPKYAISMSREILDITTQEKIGLICVDMDLKPIRDIASGISEFGESEIYILDKDNKVIFSENENLLGEDFKYFDLSLLQPGLSTQKIRISGTNYLITQQYSENPNWKYITVSNIDNLMNKNLLTARIYIISMTAVLLIIFILLSMLFSSHLTRPINLLMKAMHDSNGKTFKLVENVKTDEDVGQLILTYNDMAHRIDKLINDVYRAEIAGKEARFGALQSQMNPHFFYNALNSINCIAHVKGVEEISDLCGAMSGLYRYCVNFDNQIVTLEQELECIQKYLSIQKVRYGDKLAFILDIPENVLKAQTLKLSIQPIVENAICHGLEPQKGTGYISIKARVVSNDLQIIVEDNGAGIDDEKLHQLDERLKGFAPYPTSTCFGSTSIGIINVHERLRIRFGEKYGIILKSKKNIGTEITITMPLRF